jgi:hypothetical protein
MGSDDGVLHLEESCFWTSSRLSLSKEPNRVGALMILTFSFQNIMFFLETLDYGQSPKTWFF